MGKKYKLLITMMTRKYILLYSSYILSLLVCWNHMLYHSSEFQSLDSRYMNINEF
jgi:hypothetical protein